MHWPEMNNKLEPSGDQWRDDFSIPSFVRAVNALPSRFAVQISFCSMKAILSAPPITGTKGFVSSSVPARDVGDGGMADRLVVIGIGTGDCMLGLFLGVGFKTGPVGVFLVGCGELPGVGPVCGAGGAEQPITGVITNRAIIMIALTLTLRNETVNQSCIPVSISAQPVPNWRSPASPNPGTMYPFSFKCSSITPRWMGTSGWCSCIR